MNEPLLRVVDVHKSYRSGSRTLHILSGLNLEVQAGELVAIVGQSGSGKTSLLNVIAGLDRPEKGSIRFQGQELTQLDEPGWAKIRAQSMGFVFQFHQLLPEFSAEENVMMPGLILRKDPIACRSRAQDLLTQVGLSDRLTHKPAQLSGGEQQRVAIARALMNAPPLVLADEPTGSLDPQAGKSLFDLIQQLRKEHNMAFLFVTHNPVLAGRCDRMFALGADFNAFSKPNEV